MTLREFLIGIVGVAGAILFITPVSTIEKVVTNLFEFCSLGTPAAWSNMEPHIVDHRTDAPDGVG
jgi:hypothetical protein